MLVTYLSYLAYQREAERLRHMARRARNLHESAPPGLSRERYAERLERQALAVLAQRHSTQH